jgi:hypothetical protein
MSAATPAKKAVATPLPPLRIGMQPEAVAELLKQKANPGFVVESSAVGRARSGRRRWFAAALPVASSAGTGCQIFLA